MTVFSPDEYFARLHKAMSLLDEENIKLLQAMKDHGPRNLRKVAKKSGLSYSTVYSRVYKLQTQSALGTWIHPAYSKIGLAKAIVLVRPFPGKELLARDAVKVPGYWIKIFRCTGEPNGYYTSHAIPVTKKHEFQQFLEQLTAQGVIKDYRLVWLEEAHSILPNFEYYDLKEKSWRFEWDEWLKGISNPLKVDKKRPPVSDGNGYDKKDLIILKELAKDARVTLADLSKLLGMTLPAAKYRFDRLMQEGYVADFVISLLPFIPDASDLCEVRVDFTSEDYMNAAERVFKKTPFVVTITPVEGLHALNLRTYLPHSQMKELLSFLGTLTKNGVLSSYSYLTLDQSTQESQTFAYKYYSDESGWHYENKEYLKQVADLQREQLRHEVKPPSI